MAKANIKCRLVYLSQPEPWPNTFNDEPCAARYSCELVHQALLEQGMLVSRSLFTDNSVLLKFRAHKDIYQELRETLVEPWELPGCRKRPYQCENSALTAVRWTITSPNYYNPSGAPLVPYVCRECGYWHIGHNYKNSRQEAFTF